MNFEQVAEQPRHTLVSARVNPAAELARWLFERARVAYHEQRHVPFLRVVATRRERDGVAVVSGEAVWMGARDIVDGIDAKSRPGQRVYGEAETDRAANRAWVERLTELLPAAVGRFIYSELLSHKAILYPVIAEGAPFWERGFVYWLYPLWRRLAARRLDLTRDAVAAAPGRIRQACDSVEAELASRGTRFIGGDSPDIVDIVFASLLAPVTYPARYGAALPALATLPRGYAAFVDEMRGRRAGQLVLDTYEAARSEPQPLMPARGNGRPLSSIILEAWPQRIAARAAAAWGHVVVIFGFAIVNRWNDVEEVLRRDLDFQIAPINGARIDEVNGPFVLGLDRGPRLVTERPQLYAAVSLIDLEAVRALVAREAERLLDDAIAAGGQIDIVNGYARLVAARAARQIFGVSAPSEMDLMRVIRAVFQHTFLNLTGDEKVRQRALAASEELKAWFLDEIARRDRLGLKIDDVIGRLLAFRGTVPDALDDDGVRRNVAGLLVGAIDTTATAVAKIIRMAGDGAVLARVERAVDDPVHLNGWCYELLRMWTHNPVLLRRAASDGLVGGTTVPAGTTVVAYVQAAMFDASRFINPTRLDPTRPPALYRHFGGGLHPCSGRAVNDVQIPELVRQVLRRGIERVERPRYDGPFIDELIVSFRGGSR